jgi:twinkle protein
VLALATYVRKELGIDHLVIDSLMKCGIGVDDLTGQKDFVDGLCAIARDTGLHIHLVCHMRKGENEKACAGQVRRQGRRRDHRPGRQHPDRLEEPAQARRLAAAERRRMKPEARSSAGRRCCAKQADSFVRVAGQRHHPWEGSFAFWFDKDSQQFLEAHYAKPQYLDFEASVMR